MNHSTSPSPSPADTAADVVPSIGEVEVVGRTDIAGQTTDDGRGRVFPCEQCGADLEFHIGQQRLKCPFCGHEKELLIQSDVEIQEQDFHAMLARLKELRDHPQPAESDTNEVRCEGCGGNVVFTGPLTSTECPYCGAPILRENVHRSEHRVPVDAVLPFLVDRNKAQRLLAEWVRSRWFAPNEFLNRGVEGKFNGVYLPYWTYDSLTFNVYSGERGENYTVTVGTGKNRRTETRTRWYPASGRFQRFFDDVLVVASQGLPVEYLQALEPWPLPKCLPFTEEVLAGYFARTYDIELDAGFRGAKQRIDSAIEADVRSRIGGDKQRIHSLKSRYDAITFKHLLLPLWMLAYRFHDKPYRIYVNAGTGEVQGERPYSWVKILFAILAGLAVVGTAVALSQR